MIKIVHTADSHIGMKFKGRNYSDEVRHTLVENRFQSLERLVEQANKKHADLLIVAGDLFDTLNLPVKQISRTADIFNKFSGENVLVLPGNHDYYEDNAKGLWQKFKDVTNSELILVLDKPEPVDLVIREHEIMIYPGPCNSKHSTNNAIGWIDTASVNPDIINIGVAHGHVEGYGPESEHYFNMSEGELKSKNLDIWLLGHIHVPYPAKSTVTQPVFLYSGTHTADGFDYKYQGNAWYIELDKETFKAEEMVCSDIRFLEIEQSIRSEADIQSFEQKLIPIANKNHLVKLNITGRLNNELLEHLQQRLLHYNESFLYTETSDQVKLDIDLDYINENFKQDSLPHQLLTKLSNDPGDNLALQTAFELINESRS